jgi:hypothetical protein
MFEETRAEYEADRAELRELPSESNHSMHNHFMIKSPDLTRPGGVIGVISSAFTMDAQNPATRRGIHEKADLLGAVRLPTGAHRRAAGTDALTDVLIFRKGLPWEEPLSSAAGCVRVRRRLSAALLEELLRAHQA